MGERRLIIIFSESRTAARQYRERLKVLEDEMTIVLIVASKMDLMKTIGYKAAQVTLFLVVNPGFKKTLDVEWEEAYGILVRNLNCSPNFCTIPAQV